jgi:drug/metabolite transporter (DMT)-like permease
MGIFIMLLAELAEAIRLIITQFFLQQLKFGVIEGQYVLSPASAFWLFLASAIYELPKMYNDNAITIIANNIPAFFIASFMGIGVNYLSYLVIQYTSSLTMKILGTIRNIIIIFVGVLFYGEIVTQNEFIGYFIALLGFIGYNLAQAKYFDNFNYKTCSFNGNTADIMLIKNTSNKKLEGDDNNDIEGQK